MIPITIKTLWYSLLWVGMILVGGACYEQRLYSKKHNGKKMPTISFIGLVIITAAMLGLIHGILAFLHLALPL